MAECSEGMMKWKRKRAIQGAAVRACAVKQARNDPSTSETDRELESSTVDVPGPSGTLPAGCSESSGSESKSKKESESEYEQGSVNSSSEFTNERALGRLTTSR